MIARSTGANLRSFFESPKFIATFLHEKCRFGPVAQLGAHYIRIVGVVGSNPIRSTNFWVAWSVLLQAIRLLWPSHF